jgi:hypothetical protein
MDAPEDIVNDALELIAAEGTARRIAEKRGSR